MDAVGDFIKNNILFNRILIKYILLFYDRLWNILNFKKSLFSTCVHERMDLFILKIFDTKRPFLVLSIFGNILMVIYYTLIWSNYCIKKITFSLFISFG